MLRLLKTLWADTQLERAVEQGNVQLTAKALKLGADPNLELFGYGAWLEDQVATNGWWTAQSKGHIFARAMELEHEQIGLLLADAGASVDHRYRERIVALRWKARVKTAGGMGDAERVEVAL